MAVDLESFRTQLVLDAEASPAELVDALERIRELDRGAERRLRSSILLYLLALSGSMALGVGVAFVGMVLRSFEVGAVGVVLFPVSFLISCVVVSGYLRRLALRDFDDARYELALLAVRTLAPHLAAGEAARLHLDLAPLLSERKRHEPQRVLQRARYDYARDPWLSLAVALPGGTVELSAVEELYRRQELHQRRVQIDGRPETFESWRLSEQRNTTDLRLRARPTKPASLDASALRNALTLPAGVERRGLSTDEGELDAELRVEVVRDADGELGRADLLEPAAELLRLGLRALASTPLKETQGAELDAIGLPAQVVLDDLVVAACVDKRLDPAERELLLRQTEALGLHADALTDSLRRVEQGELSRFRVPPSETGRHALLSAVADVFAADGRVGRRERKALERLAEHLELAPEPVLRRAESRASS